METIKDIIQEMREFADADSQSIGRDVLRRRIQHFADRIEQAVTNCNQLKMREAVYGIKNTANSALTALSIGNDMSSFLWDIIRKCEAALSALPRNCDLYSHDEALRIWSSLPESEEDGCFDEWLFAEAKGESK